jgi:hypothetical protein
LAFFDREGFIILCFVHEFCKAMVFDDGLHPVEGLQVHDHLELRIVNRPDRSRLGPRLRWAGILLLVLVVASIVGNRGLVRFYQMQQTRAALEREIEQITRQLRGTRVKKAAPAKRKARKKPRFSKEERLRRAKRMKAYWDNWRKQKKAGK